ncbi:hypothetical protein KR084_009859 [Drosophila pseudotakahashii]|nr:hypothetical protein KR084_009859 [Drosophila pseudotakahashii]
MKVGKTQSASTDGDIQRGRIGYPRSPLPDSFVIYEQGFVNGGAFIESDKVRSMYPDAGSIVHLHLG